MNTNDNEQAVSFMKRVLKDRPLGKTMKREVIEDFGDLAETHPEFENDWINILEKEDKSEWRSDQALGDYYVGKDNPKALSYFQNALADTPDNFKLIKKTLALQLKEEEFSEALQLAKRSLSNFPSQPDLYLSKGRAEKALGAYENAQESLGNGMDWVIDAPEKKEKFYRLLAKVFEGLDNPKKAETFEKKTNTLKNDNSR